MPVLIIMCFGLLLVALLSVSVKWLVEKSRSITPVMWLAGKIDYEMTCNILSGTLNSPCC